MKFFVIDVNKFYEMISNARTLRDFYLEKGLDNYAKVWAGEALGLERLRRALSEVEVPDGNVLAIANKGELMGFLSKKEYDKFVREINA